MVNLIEILINKASLNRHKLILLTLLALFLWSYVYPQKMADIWLTRDQQGAYLFQKGQYAQAAKQFTDVQWQAFSLYGAEKFKQSATIYGQFTDTDQKFAQANAQAHAGEYLKARNSYLKIIKLEEDHHGAKHNMAIVQKIIDDINRMSESQKAEAGDSPKELGDAPKRADGADKMEMRKQVIEQYSADQLLLDPELNAMWMRQVQKDPAKFLTQKFTMQSQRVSLSEVEVSRESGDKNAK